MSLTLMKLLQFGGLESHHIQALRKLTERCQQQDKTSVRIYWNLISSPRTIPGDLCLFNDENQLIAYLGFFHFNHDEAEITALVDPAFRQSGCLKILLKRADELFKALDLKKWIFCCPANNTITHQLLNQNQAKHRISEYDLLWDPQTKLSRITKKGYQKRLATFADLNELVQLDACCLGDDPDKIRYHFSTNLREPNRQTWMLYDQVHFIGKIHLHFQNDTVFIHNICIRPEYQSQGFGYYFLNDILCDLIESGNLRIKMEVEALNDRALALYLKLGFKIIAHYEFWEVDATNNP